MQREARAAVTPMRQRTQYTCMATSMTMCLQANGISCDEDTVNRVLGAQPMKGAAWEHALACAQHYGMRGTLVCPATLRQVKTWTDAGIPVMIAWNPEGRDWSHASVVFHVAEGPVSEITEGDVVEGSGPGLYVWVADPNIPNPDKTTRIVHEDLFYKRWSEKWPDYLVRRPALAIEPEITREGRQVVASKSTKIAEEADCLKDYQLGGLSYREYQDCLRRFRGPGSGRHRQPMRDPAPKKADPPAPRDFVQRADRLLLALLAVGDRKNVRHIWFLRYEETLPEWRLSNFEALEQKHSSIIRDMPSKPELWVDHRGGYIINVKGMSNTERQRLERHFDLEPAPHKPATFFRLRSKRQSRTAGDVASVETALVEATNLVRRGQYGAAIRVLRPQTSAWRTDHRFSQLLSSAIATIDDAAYEEVSTQDALNALSAAGKYLDRTFGRR